MYIVILKYASVVSPGNYWNIISNITHGRQLNQNWMQIFPLSLYNGIQLICEKPLKKVSLMNFSSHYTPGSIGSVFTPTSSSFQTCFEIKYVPDMDLDKRWQLIKLPILYLDWCVFGVKERGLSRKTAAALNFICHRDFLAKVWSSYQICNHRNKKVNLTKIGPFSSIVFSQQFLNGFKE